MGSFVKSAAFGRPRHCWVCNDVWMDILPLFDRPQLGLKLALISPRFDVLVDKHFDGQSELTIWRPIIIRKDAVAAVPKLFVLIGGRFVHFPLPDGPLPNKIRFKHLQIEYIDHSLIAFLRSNKEIWDKRGNKLYLHVYANKTISDAQQIWDILALVIWPIFATNIRHLSFADGDHLDNLRRLISPTILTDINQFNSIGSGDLLSAGFLNGPNATAGQALSKWLHTPRKDGQPKQLSCFYHNNWYNGSRTMEWINNLKEAFLRATISSSAFYKILFHVHQSAPIGPFELVNNRTNEKLTLNNKADGDWLLKRCPTIEETAVQRKGENWDDNLNIVHFLLGGCKNSLGPLFPPAEEVGQCDGKVGRPTGTVPEPCLGPGFPGIIPFGVLADHKILPLGRSEGILNGLKGPNAGRKNDE